MVSAKSVILEYVCPSAGIIIGNAMFAAPCRDLQLAIKGGNLGDLNPTPWAFMLGNCFGWVFYSMLLKNYWIFFGNAPGLILSVWLNMGAVKLLYQGHYSRELLTSLLKHLHEREAESAQQVDLKKTASWLSTSTIELEDLSKKLPKPPARHEKLILGMVVMWTVCVSVVAFASTLTPVDQQLIVGVVTNGILIFFYGAPLSTVLRILRDRTTNSLHIPTMILNTLNGTFWMCYGIAVDDYFVYAPNGIGACLGGVQIVLSFIFPRSKGETNNDDIENNHRTETSPDATIREQQRQEIADGSSCSA